MANGPHLGISLSSSAPSPTVARRPPEAAPNVVMVVLDDTGFGQLGCFGSDIRTPRIDQLASEGLRYNRFHVTSLCSPTRACLLTGRNHHAVGMGFLTDIPISYPGYNARIPKSAATLARILRDSGYSTFAVGKWHLTPRNDRTASGPFDMWPLGLGFERYYGFLHGDSNQWAPTLVSDNHYVEPPARPEEGYHLTEDLADTAIRLIRDQQHATAGKPFFLYFATGAMHAPHHVAPEWVEPYHGMYDAGWERWREEVFERQLASGVVPEGTTLTPRPSWVQEWDDLPGDQRRLFSRMQEIFAGFLTHTDHQVGRLVDFLAEIGELDSTMILVLSDNGTSAEGGRVGSVNEHRFGFGVDEDLEENLARIDELGGFRTYNHYPWGWAWAGNTPFRLWKRYTWLGGTRTPLVLRCPAQVESKGAVRSPFCHAVDLMPTILDVCGLEAPGVVDGVDQLPLDGASLRSTFEDPSAKGRRIQYFEMIGSRSIYYDGWKATTDHVSKGVLDEERLLEGSRDLEQDRWMLFRLDEDFSEAHDLASEMPAKVGELEALWWVEAGRNGVLPIEDSFFGRFVAFDPPAYRPASRCVFRPGGGPVADEAVPSIAGGGRITVELDVPEGPAEGVLCAQGDWSNGWALLVLEGKPAYVVSATGKIERIVADQELPPGPVSLCFEYTPEAAGGGSARLLCGAGEIGRGTLSSGLAFAGMQIGGGGLRIGHDSGFPVCDDYVTPFPWNGGIERLVFEVGAPRRASAAEGAGRQGGRGQGTGRQGPGRQGRRGRDAGRQGGDRSGTRPPTGSEVSRALRFE